MKNMTLGAYLPYDSFMHRIDPRAKISALMVMLIAVFFDAGFLGYAIIGAMTLLALKLAKIKIKFILKFFPSQRLPAGEGEKGDNPS